MSRNLFVRRDFLKSFIVFLSALSTNMRYNSSDIFTLVSLSVREEEMSFFKFDNTLHNQPFETAWSERIRLLPKSLSLKKSDKELLSEFGRELGKTDIDGQLKHIELYKTVVLSRRRNQQKIEVIQNNGLVCRNFNSPDDDIRGNNGRRAYFQNSGCWNYCGGAYSAFNTKRTRGTSDAYLSCRTYSGAHADSNPDKLIVHNN